AALEVLSQPARHQAGCEGDGRARYPRVADDGDVVARQELIGVADGDVWEQEVGRDGLLVVPLLDLEDSEVVRGVACYVARPEVELGWLVSEVRVRHEDGVPVVVDAPVQVASHVIVSQYVTGRADDGARAGPVHQGSGFLVVRDYLNDGFEDVEPHRARQALSERGSSDPQEQQ